MQYFYPDPQAFSATQQIASHAIHKPDGTWHPIEPLDDFGDANRLGLLSFAVRCPTTGVIYDALVGSFYKNYSQFLSGMGHRYPILMGIALSVETPKARPEPTVQYFQTPPSVPTTHRHVREGQRHEHSQQANCDVAFAPVFSFAPTPTPTGKREAIVAAYEHFLAGSDGAGNWLAGEIRLFALKKANKDLFDFKEGAVTPDDLAQDITIYVLEHLGDFRGEAPSFYSWLNRICYTSRANAVVKAVEEKKAFVELFIQSYEDDPEGELVENPLIHERRHRPEYQRPLPDFIQGDDYIICGYIRDGFDYQEIAARLEISVHALEARVNRLKKKVLQWKKDAHTG